MAMNWDDLISQYQKPQAAGSWDDLILQHSPDWREQEARSNLAAMPQSQPQAAPAPSGPTMLKDAKATDWVSNMFRDASIGGMAKGLYESGKSAASLPGDVFTGAVDPNSDEAGRRALEFAGWATPLSGASSGVFKTRGVRNPGPSVERQKAEAGLNYMRAKDSGLEVTPESFEGLVSGITRKVEDDGIDPILEPRAHRALERFQQAVAKPEVDDVQPAFKMPAQGVDNSTDLFTFIRRNFKNGIKDEGGGLTSEGVNRVPGIVKEGGASLNEVRESLVQAGYLPKTIDDRDVIDLIVKRHRAGPNDKPKQSQKAVDADYEDQLNQAAGVVEARIQDELDPKFTLKPSERKRAVELSDEGLDAEAIVTRLGEGGDEFDALVSAAIEVKSAGKGVSLQQLDTLRKVAGRAAQSIEPSDRRFGKIIRDQVDEYLDNIKDTDISAGNKDGIEALKIARKQWATMRKSETIDEIMEVAKLDSGKFSVSGNENAIRSGFRALGKKIIKDKREAARWTDAEKKAIKKLGNPLGAINMLRWLGKLSPSGAVPIGLQVGIGATGGVPLAIATSAAGFGAKHAASGLMTRKANNLNAMVRGGTTPPNALRRLNKRNALVRGGEINWLSEEDPYYGM
jgi:hypothetical protein